MSATAALMGMAQVSPLPLVYQEEQTKRFINPNTPVTDTKKLKGIRLVCTTCRYETSHSSHMTRHMRAHSGNKPHACVHCNYRCSQKANLERHVRSRHSGLKPFSCPHCDYCSAQKSHIEGHVRARHSNEAPLTCTECDFVAATASLMLAHVTATHLVTKRPLRAANTKKRSRSDVASVMNSVAADDDDDDEHFAFPGFYNAAVQQEQKQGQKYTLVVKQPVLKKSKKSKIKKSPVWNSQVLNMLQTNAMTHTTHAMYKQNTMTHIDQTLLSLFASSPMKQPKVLHSISTTGMMDLTCDEEF